jgi:sugar phosphate isomerase/epimerase
MKRRKFLYRGTQAAFGLGLVGLAACNNSEATAADENDVPATETGGDTPLWFQISLAQWSLHKTLFAGDLDNLDFAAKAKNDFGVEGIEYVNQFFKDKAKDTEYLKQMKQRAADNGVQSLLIMVDGEGNLGDTDAAARQQAVQNHFRWVDAAQFLGCHSIRVNAAGQGTAEEVGAAATEGLHDLAEYAAQAGLNVIVENHGGYSSNGQWLANVIKNTEMENCGTLPDFGNFCIQRTQGGCAEEYDRYQGVRELMPYAKAVSAKANNFDAEGWEVDMDYPRLLGIVKEAGYTGWIGIEYEGSDLSEDEGIRRTKELLIKAGRMTAG